MNNIMLLLHYIFLCALRRRETVTEKTSKIFLSLCEDEILKVKAAAALPEGECIFMPDPFFL